MGDNMSEVPNTTDAPNDEAANSTADAPTPTPEKDETDWKAEARKWEGRAKENLRATEALQPIKEQFDALQRVFGGEPSKGKPEDVVATLQQQVADMRHDTLVERVARSHGITDDDDVAVLREVKDEALMQRLAQRLKAPVGPIAPAPDPGQGARPATPQAEADAEYAKFFPTP